MISMTKKTQEFSFMKDNGELGWCVEYPDGSLHHCGNKADLLIIVMHQFKDAEDFSLTLKNWAGKYKKLYYITKTDKIFNVRFTANDKRHIYTSPKSAYSNILNDFLYDKSAPEFENFKVIVNT